jgi:hypothetical protein
VRAPFGDVDDGQNQHLVRSYPLVQVRKSEVCVAGLLTDGFPENLNQFLVGIQGMANNGKHELSHALERIGIISRVPPLLDCGILGC